MRRSESEPVSNAAEPRARLSLPAWVYRNEEFFALERERIFMRSWQVVCHVGDVPEAGDYHLFDFCGEPVFVMRGRDGALRAFYNVCRHRAARLLDGAAGSAKGNCGGRIRCPYHAWTYDLDGRLAKVPHESAYRGLEKAAHGLPELELEVWRGFIFVRFEPGGPPVAEIMAPYDAELEPYRLEQMRPLGRVTLRPREVNWKTVTDNYGDGLHINVAHTGLRRIVGRSYRLGTSGLVQTMTGVLEPNDRAGWSERMYCKHLPAQEHLPAGRRRRWSYYLLWPNVAFDIYPDQVDFMQMIPLSPTRTMIREIPYGLPGASRAMRAARYLNWRINRVVNAEDTGLIERVQAGMASRSYSQGPLSDDEVCLNAFAEQLRKVIPAAKLPEAPAPGRLGSGLQAAD